MTAMGIVSMNRFAIGMDISTDWRDILYLYFTLIFLSLQECVAMCLELLAEKAASEGVASTSTDHQAALLANLQDIQDREAHVVVKRLPNKVQGQGRGWGEERGKREGGGGRERREFGGERKGRKERGEREERGGEGERRGWQTV